MKLISAPKRPIHYASAQHGGIRRALLFGLGIVGLAVGLYAVAGLFGGPWLVDRWLAQYQRAAPERTADRAALRFNPFTLAGEIRGLDIRDDDAGVAFAADRLVIDFSASSLIERRPVIASILIEGSAVRVASVSQLAAFGRRARSLGLEHARIERLSLTAGTLTAGTLAAGSDAAPLLELTRYDLSLTAFDADSDAGGRLVFDGASRTGVTVAAEATLAADLARADGQLRFGALELGAAADRIGGALASFMPQGRVDLSADFSATSLLAEPRLDLANADLELAELFLTPGADLTVTTEPASATGSFALAPTGDGIALSGRLEIASVGLAVNDARTSPPQSFALEQAAVLTTIDADTADLSLNLAGRVVGAGEATVTVRVPPGTAGATRVSIRALELPASMLSAYAVDAVGRRLTAGELDLRVEYSLNTNRVDGSLGIVSRELAFAGATTARLPGNTGRSLDLAAALLEDADGIIELQLPFASSAGPVRDAAAAALEARIAAVTDTPFDALAPIIGNATASAVPFLPGDAALNDRALAAIRQLAEALTARPRLAMRVHGSYDPIADREALAEQQIELHVQLATAGPGDQARPAPVDFGSARARDVLDEFAGERLQAEDVAELRERYQCEGALAEICARTYYESIFDALVANEEITPTALSRLGRFRALSVIDALRQRGIADGRIELVTGGDVVETPFGIGLAVELTAGSTE